LKFLKGLHYFPKKEPIIPTSQGYDVAINHSMCQKLGHTLQEGIATLISHGIIDMDVNATSVGTKLPLATTDNEEKK